MRKSFSKAVLISVITACSFIKVNAQQVFISANGGITESFLKNGYTFNNWGVNGGIGITYTLKDTLFSIELQALCQSISDNHYSGNAILVPLFLRINPRNINDFHILLGPYFESLMPNDFNASWKKEDYGAAIGISYIKPVFKKLLLGADVAFFYGLNQPVEENEPTAILVGGIPYLTGDYYKDYFNMQSFILNFKIIYRLK